MELEVVEAGNAVEKEKGGSKMVRSNNWGANVICLWKK